MWKQEEATVADRAAVAAKFEELAEEGGVGLTPHSVAIARAREGSPCSIKLSIAQRKPASCASSAGLSRRFERPNRRCATRVFSTLAKPRCSREMEMGATGK
jgi:hypothetical protein